MEKNSALWGTLWDLGFTERAITQASQTSKISASAICERAVESRRRRTISILQAPGARLPFAISHARADADADANVQDLLSVGVNSGRMDMLP